ncbi:M48 family metalloprotease [Brevibacterium luteolum]|uniref:Peptidase M48 domain-containing protein n=1 Tax=Brevibacterium luteolum TaxID=199591 RepID=A0A6G8KUQ9_9MICO|nr:M48 family metalloprotease [Brevibacterium luteolum]QIN28542.1 hypothetical protein EW640_04045 [Brevibacterium luteolum]
MLTLVALSAAATAALIITVPRLLAPGSWALRHPATALRLWMASLVAVIIGLITTVLSGVLAIVTAVAGYLHPAHLLIPVAVSAVMIAAAAVWFRLKHRHHASVRSVHAAVAALEPHIISRSQREAFVLARVGSPEVFSYAVARTPAEAGVGSRPMVIVSTGMQQLLTEAQLQTIIAHEYAHVRCGHETILRTAALTAAMTPPALRYGQAMQRSVALLVELAADDIAAGRAGAVHLANALAAVSAQTGDPSLDLRAERLTLGEWTLTHRLTVPADFRVA